MPVEFEDIAIVLAAQGLLVPNLNVLAPDALPYEVLAIQPVGPLRFAPDFVGHQDREVAIRKFSQFFELAQESNADLVISPEYSCPWEALEAVWQGGNYPASGKLWALGCESITPANLAALRMRVPGLVFICETPQVAVGSFLDPICYVFRTESNAGVEKIVAVIQFKTIPMGGGEIFERNHMISGTRRYFLRNRGHDHLRFYTVICSEALEFEITQAKATELCQHPSIIFHPQMIKDARHASIRKYRADLFGNTCSDDLEVYCLNWAREWKSAEAPPHTPLSSKGNSAVFSKSKRFDRSDTAIKNNHALGLYYSFWKDHEADLCILNFEEHVFLFTNQKIFLVGAAVRSRRTGPTIRQLRTWDSDSDSWQITAKADDGFNRLCSEYQSPKLQLCVNDNIPVVDRERLLTLSAGTLEPTVDWHKVEKLSSFISESDERSKRLTFVHECATASIEFRNEHLTRFIKLQTTFLDKEAIYPPNIQDLRGNLQITVPQADTDYRFNLVHRENGKSGATVMFVGTKARQFVCELFDKICKAWGGREEKYKEERTRRIVIAYEDVNGSVKTINSRLPGIADSSEPPSSILGDETP